jgi:hypothetical protein
MKVIISVAFKQKITGSLNSTYGSSVGISENIDIAIIGGPSDNQNGTNAGAVMIYTGGLNSQFFFKQKLTGIINSRFGHNLKIIDYSFPIVLREVCTGNVAIQDPWTSIFYYTSCRNRPIREIPSSKSLCSVILVGAPSENNGAVYIYTGNKNSEFKLQQKLTGNYFNGRFGSSIDYSIKSNVICIGSGII